VLLGVGGLGGFGAGRHLGLGFDAMQVLSDSTSTIG
jgi:hypothetical protein